MSLGVLNNLSAMSAANNLNNTQNALSKTLQQLSSGSKINSGADDAAGLSLVNGLQANATALAQSQTNATEGVGLLTVADGALSQVTNLLNRAVTLATEVSNGTLNASQNTAANQEYQSILSEINNIGATTTYNQKQVFGSNTSIYTGDSSTQGASINQLNIRSLSSANVGDSNGAMSYSNGTDNVFLDLSKGGVNAAASDSLGLASKTTTIQVSYMTNGANGAAVQGTANISVGAGTSYDNTAQGLMNAINSSGLGLTASFGTATQAGSAAVSAAKAANATGGGANDTGIIISGSGVGTGTNAAGGLGTLTVAAGSDTLGGNLSIVGSDGKAHNIALGTINSTDNVANLASTINSLGYGVTASLNTQTVGGHAAGTVLSFSSANSSVTVSGSSLKDGGSSVSLAGTPTVSGGAYSATIGTISSAAPADAGDTLADGGSINIGSSVVTVSAANGNNTLSKLTDYLNANKFGVTATYDSTNAKITLSSSNSGLTLSGALTDQTNGGNVETVSAAVADHSQIGTLKISGATDATTDVLTAGKTIQIGGNTFTTTAETMSQFATDITNANTGITATYTATAGSATGTMTFTATSASAQGISIASSNLADTTHGAATFAIATDTPSIDTSVYYKIGINVPQAGNITDTTTQGGTLNTGLAMDNNGSTGVATISYSDSAGQSLAATDLSNSTDAQSALTSLNGAIAALAAQDGYIGAQINTLNAVSSVMSTQQQNVIAAQNAVQATDYATAASNMSKYQILSQTGISALAQANSMQQEVLKLLQ